MTINVKAKTTIVLELECDLADRWNLDELSAETTVATFEHALENRCFGTAKLWDELYDAGIELQNDSLSATIEATSYTVTEDEDEN